MASKASLKAAKTSKSLYVRSEDSEDRQVPHDPRQNNEMEDEEVVQTTVLRTTYSLTDHLKDCFHSGLQGDVVMRGFDGPIHAPHGLVLASASTHLRDLLRYHRETPEETVEILFPDFSSRQIAGALQLIYTGELQVDSPTNHCSVADVRNLLSHLGFSNSAFALKDETDLASSNSNQKPTASKTPARVKENYVCSICDMNCFKKSRLELHMRIHNKYRPFQCEICSKTFSYLHGLNRHKLFHSKHAQHKCLLCKKAFVLKSDLKKHIDCVHTTTKKFCCQICGRCFGRNDHLKVHTKTHERKVMLSPTSPNDSDSALVTGHNLSTRKQTGKKTHRGSDEEDNGMAIIEERRVVQFPHASVPVVQQTVIMPEESVLVNDPYEHTLEIANEIELFPAATGHAALTASAEADENSTMLYVIQESQGETNNELLIDEASRDSVEVVSTARNEVVEVIHIESENVVPPESEIVEIKK